MFLSKYGVARHIYIPIVKRGSVDFAVSGDWTPATGDVKISKDGGSAANVTNLPVAITMGNTAMWDFSLTATEMQAAQIAVTVADSATKAVEDQQFDIETYGNASAQHAVDLSDTVRAGLTALPNAAAEASGGLFTRGTGAGQINQDANGRINVNVAAIETADPTDTIRDAVVDDATRIDASALNTATGTTIPAINSKTTNLPSDPADASDIAGSFAAVASAISGLNDLSAAEVNAEVDTAIADAGLATATNLQTVDDNVDAIRAKTDNLPSDPADASVIAGRFDTLDTLIGDLPTNSELATALAGADDAVLAAIAALHNVSVADVLTTQMTESYAANGTAPTLAQALFAIHQLLMQFAIAGTSVTVKKLDGTTTAFVGTLDSDTAPTSMSRD